METRVFGRTGMQLSLLGFGCGAVGGLMIREATADIGWRWGRIAITQMTPSDIVVRSISQTNRSQAASV
jgi:hypothetical protein